MGAKYKGVPYFRSLLRLKAPTARVQTTLKMFLRQCTLRLGRSAKFPLGKRGNKRASSQRTMRQKTLILGEIMNIHEYANELICITLLQFKEQFMRFHLIPVTLF
jgi:hypothetical protein